MAVPPYRHRAAIAPLTWAFIDNPVGGNKKDLETILSRAPEMAQDGPGAAAGTSSRGV